MTFEQLELIQKDIHPLTRQRLISETVLKEALWLQVKLRSKIESASERDTKLNMTIQPNNNIEDDEDETNEDKTSSSNSSLFGKYYPIPTDDTTTYTGESTITLASSLVPNMNNNKKKSPSSLSPQPSLAVEQYSIYPPFRFSVEFSDVNSLKHGMRVYSDIVFYAG
jgi:hypothetical protein